MVLRKLNSANHLFRDTFMKFLMDLRPRVASKIQWNLWRPWMERHQILWQFLKHLRTEMDEVLWVVCL